MIYCMSDIHGRLDLFEQMLDKISFSHNDTLYILGDVIDRGGGLSVLQRVMELQKNGLAKLIRGNHDENFAECIPYFDPAAALNMRENVKARKEFEPLNGTLLGSIGSIINNIDYIRNFDKTEKSTAAAMALSGYGQYRSTWDYFALDKHEQHEVLEFIKNAPIYEDIEVNGKKYRLTHAGCKHDGEMNIHIRQDFFRHKNPLKDTTIVFGHTTTKDIRIMVDGVYTTPSIWYDSFHNNDKIGIDCGASFYGGRLACLRLDDMKEFYIDNEQDMSLYVEDMNHFARIFSFPVNPDYAYSSVFAEICSIVREIYADIEKEGKEKYGEYFAPYISHYPSLTDADKEKWINMLKMIDLDRQLVELCPDSENYRNSLERDEERLEEFYSEHNIAIR